MGVLGDSFRSSDLGGGGRTLWVTFVIFLPWLGILVYLIAPGEGHAGASAELTALHPGIRT